MMALGEEEGSVEHAGLLLLLGPLGGDGRIDISHGTCLKLGRIL